MPRPEEERFEDGFNWRTVVGAFFVGLIMMPASIYLSMFSGGGIGGAAEWVTIIFFVELARRSVQALKKQEIIVLNYTAAGLAGGGMFSGFIWNQFLRQSREAAEFGVAQGMPTWAAPVADSVAIVGRQLWHHDWWPAIGLALLGSVLSRLNWIGMGYFLFRLTSDVERLPFPMVRIWAEGAMALAESPDRKDNWRWRVFSIGSMLGLGFAVIYIGIPAVTGQVLVKPFQLLPIPWLDLTVSGENLLPAAPLAISFEIGTIIWGMILPFWMVIGQFGMCILSSIIMNPILQRFGVFPTWQKGMSVLSTQFATNFDFYLSISAGVAFSVAVIGIWQLVKALRAKKPGPGEPPRKEITDIDILLGREGNMMVSGGGGSFKAPEGRGDFPIWVALGMWAIGTAGYVALCHWLVPRFPMALLIFFGFIWTPVTSYVSARMIGLTGNGVWFPYIREASFILSGYKGVDIWFAPIPLGDYGGVPSLFRMLHLTRTKFTSIIKAELLMFPISIVFSFVYWAFFWYLASIPSSAFPFIDKMWPFNAITTSLWMTATMEGRQWLLEALKPVWIGTGFIGGMATFGMLSVMKWPIFLFYGAISGIGAMPNGPLLLFIGALLSKLYFQPRFGAERWIMYAPVLAAGFACGGGLVAMLAAGLTMATGSVVTKPF